MRKSDPKGRLVFLLGITVTLAAVFIARLVQWQITDSGRYTDETCEGELYTINGDALRGEICDVNGVKLAANLSARRIVLNKLFIDGDALNGIISELVDIMELCGEEWIDELPIIPDGSGYRFDKDNRTGIAEMISLAGASSDISAGDCLEILAEKYGCQGFPTEKRRNIVSVRYNMSRSGYSREKPYVFAENISESTTAAVSERMSSVSGVSVETYAVRTYLNGTAAPHIVGITGFISQEEYSALEGKGYSYNDIIGKSGIEAAFESELRGTAGSRTYSQDADGTVRLVSSEPTRPGNSVYLTVDTKMQETARKALSEAVNEANGYALQTGDKSMGADCLGAAAVVLNVKDFSVLCAVSFPGYDLSEYYEDYERLSSDEAAPFFDRAFAGALAPGSTYKPLVACAALEEKKLALTTEITCSGFYTTGGMKLWCMGCHGAQDMDSAMVNSCNVFFAEAGRLLGIDALDRYALRCGLGAKTGVEIYESAGTLAGPEYSGLMGTEWYPDFVSPAAIGQSDNQFTPLQLGVYAATLANGGKRLRAHVVDRIVKYGTGETVCRTEPELLDDMGVSRENLDAVRLAMYHAASGYAPLADYPVKIAGKTGTAENNGSDHANFICFAPFDDPEIAVAVMVEHGAKSYIAVRAAKKILDGYFGLSGDE